MSGEPFRVYWRIGVAGTNGVPAPADAAEWLASWLAAEEIVQAARLKFAKRRSDWIAGRLNLKALLVAVVADRCGVTLAPRHLVIDRQPSGAPRVRLSPEAERLGDVRPGRPLPVAVSNSHSHDRSMAAAIWLDDDGARGRALAVGADLEFIEPRSEVFLRDYLTSGEQAYWSAAPDTNARNLRANLVWSAKEAVLKVLQLGLSADTRWLTCLPGSTAPDEEDGSQAVDARPSTTVASNGIRLVPDRPAWASFSVETDPRLQAESVGFTGFWRRSEDLVATIAVGERVPAQHARSR